GLFEQAPDLAISRIALQDLRQNRLGTSETDELRVLIEGNADRTGLFGKRLEHSLSNPPDGVRNELHALVRIELSDGLEQAFVANGDELAQVESVALLLLHVGDDEAEVRRYQPLSGRFVALLRPSR